MRTIKRYLLKLLVGAAIGAVVGALAGWLVLGQGVVILAILGALAFASLGTLSLRFRCRRPLLPDQQGGDLPVQARRLAP